MVFYPHIGQYGGIERNIVGLASVASERGLRLNLVCYYDHVGMQRYAPDIKLLELGDHPVPWIKAFRLRKALQALSGELVGRPLFFDTKAGFYGALAWMNGFVFHYTDPPSLLTQPPKSFGLTARLRSIRGKLAHAVNTDAVHRAARCITMTRRNAAELEALYGRAFEVVYQGGVPIAGVASQPAREPEKPLTLFSVCRLTPSKNLNWILHAAKELSSHSLANTPYSEVSVVLAGEGPVLDELKRLAQELGLRSQVTFPGFLDAADLEDAFARADLFLVPARQGYGLPVLEALYRGVPVVLNRESRISELFAENPWVAVSEDSCEGFVEATKNQLIAVTCSRLDREQIGKLPTESGWAHELGQVCGWW